MLAALNGTYTAHQEMGAAGAAFMHGWREEQATQRSAYSLERRQVYAASFNCVFVGKCHGKPSGKITPAATWDVRLQADVSYKPGLIILGRDPDQNRCHIVFYMFPFLAALPLLRQLSGQKEHTAC